MNSWPQGAIPPLGGTPNRPLIGSADVRDASGTPAKFAGYPARLVGVRRPPPRSVRKVNQALDWLSENVWPRSSARLASAKMFGANQALDWLQRKCLEPIKHSIGFSENVWCQSSTRLASAKMFGLKQTSNRFRPLSAERSGGLNGYAKNGMGDGAGHAASFLVLTGGKGAKTVETSAKAGKRAERLAQPPRLGRGLSLLSSKRGVATRLRRAWRGRPQRSARR